ncbi:MAG: hypothetical protein H6668_12405 [Ardenticatenaceae bacterium]|nr:hypothetical protein [Ardenticatenaceae bacterium]
MNELLDKLGDFFGDRPGFLPLLGLGLIVVNFVLQLVPGPGSGWFVDSNLLLHLGLVVAIVGILLIRVLR